MLPTAEVDTYKPGSSTSRTPVAPLPPPLLGIRAVAATDGSIYVFGGGKNQIPINTDVYVYTPSTNSWSTHIDLPSEYSSYNPGAAALGPDGADVSTTHLKVKVTISQSAPTGPGSVSVTTDEGTGTCTGCLTVTCPATGSSPA